jgi:transcriptional regulator with XRE-family HTH domain
MGSEKRTQPKKLSHKLKAIRLQLGLTQEEMVKALKKHARREQLVVGYISRFENGKREPALPVLLAYARLAGVSTDALIDDRMKLPNKFKP